MINIAFIEKEIALGLYLPSLARKWKHISLQVVTDSVWNVHRGIGEGSFTDIHVVLIYLKSLCFKELSGIKYLHEAFPTIKIMGVSEEPDSHLIKLSITMGASSYCCLNDHDNVLEQTILETNKNGRVINRHVKEEFFSEDFDPYIPTLSVNGKNISSTEIKILSLSPTDLTYKQIAEMVNLSHKTIDRHREILFRKFNIKTRQGLALFAVKHGLYQL